MKFRPRFSMRTLAIIVTLVCAYFGAWEATKRYGVDTWPSGVSTITSPMPFIVTEKQIRLYMVGDRGMTQRIRHHLWIFGYVVKLPFESEEPFEEPIVAETVHGYDRRIK